MKRVVVSVVALCVMGLPGCAALKQTVGYPGVSVEGVDVGGLNFSGLKFTFDIKIDNHYNVGLPLVGFDYALSTGGKLFLQGETPVSSVIPAKSSRVIPLNLTIPYKTILDLKDRVRLGEEIPYRVDIGLKVDAPVVGVVNLPMDADGMFTIPKFP